MPNIFLIIVVFLAGLAIEALGTAISVIGVSSMFGGNVIIIAFILAIDIGKVVTISVAYNFWEKMGLGLKAFSLVAIVVTMTISSSGAAGYFSGEFQKAMVGNQTMLIEIQALQEQKEKYEARKKQIDEQVANLPNTYAAARIRMMNAFKAEQQDLVTRINAIEDRLPALQAEQLKVETKAGPILAIAKALEIPVETTTNFVIGLLILVFNPFAVFLITLANFLIKERRKIKDAQVVENKEEIVKPVEPAVVVAVEPVIEVEKVAAQTEHVEERAEEQDEVHTEEQVESKEESVDDDVVESADAVEAVEPEETASEIEHEIERVTVNFTDEVNVAVDEDPAMKVYKVEPFTEPRLTKVSKLSNQWSDFKSQLLDENLNVINDGTIVDAYTNKE